MQARQSCHSRTHSTKCIRQNPPDKSTERATAPDTSTLANRDSSDDDHGNGPHSGTIAHWGRQHVELSLNPDKKEAIEELTD
jgi:hypothetical protein